MNDPIAWLGDGTGQGRWGTPQTLTLPISDRGLLLADGLFETLLVEAGQAWLLEEHLARWQSSAALLGLPPPPGAATVQPLITAAIERSGIGKALGSSGALRLNWSRGSGPRGIDPPRISSPSFWLQLNPHQPNFDPVRVIVSPTERRCATSLLSQCKTFAYGPSIQARRQAQAAGADDALLPSTNGELSCGTTTNLMVRSGSGSSSGSGWITPPLSSGCLPGVMRQRGLDRGLITEAPVHEDDLQNSAGALLLNSLGCRAISHLGAALLANPAQSGGDSRAAETFWRQLLQASP